MKGFFTYYNTLFNSKTALDTELSNRDKTHKDNFYAPYIHLLTYEEDSALLNDLNGENSPENSTIFSNNPTGIPSSNLNNNSGKSATILEISEAKALKAIDKYSVIKNGIEKNKKMFDAHLLLAQARIYQGKPLESIDALNYIFVHMKKDKRMPLAKIYEALAYAKMGNYFKSNELFLALKNEKLKKKYKKLASLYYSETLLKYGKKQLAVDELENAYNLNKNRKLRSRISFLRGQILASLGKNEEARESFVTAYKNANDFEFEVKSQVEIAKTFNGKDDDYEGAKKYLENISKKGTYASRKNEFYYAFGLMANKAGKKEEAKEFFAKSLKEKMSDPQIRGLDFYEIGKAYFDNDDYLSAGAYYDSALAVMNYQPTKILLKEQSENIKKLTANYYLIKKNDSILNLAKMSEAEKETYFNKYIEKIKAKEAAELAQQKRDEHSKGFDTGDYNANSIFNNTGGNAFQDFGATSAAKGFYFANQNAVSKGESDFKRIWGDRSLIDNWRTSAHTNTLEDLKNKALGITSTKDPRRLETSFYIEKIPTDGAEIFALKKARDTASLGLGRMFENYFGNTKLATKTLYDLVDAKPEDDVKLQALYQIFAMNFEKNPTAAERAKQLILSDFPYSSYAEYVKNPKNNNFSQSSPEVEKTYAKAFDLYEQEKFNESKALIDSALVKYPKDGLVPKFTLLNAFNAGKTSGKEIMILQLEQIALNYAKTPEGEKAREMLKYLKSDISVEMTDENGKKIKDNSVPQTIKPTAPTNINSMKSDDPIGINPNGNQKIGPPPLRKRRPPNEIKDNGN
ncbi:tetratricopeptide repeat protein [Halpernia sp.]|uniref:type IX secretion system periplasmic lipoprotein PorW/SprE n=1 Tax=Halpernia sp. TaxID=2782209 RepID=UPI003A8E29B3